MTTEYIDFTVSKDLLKDVITRQSGSPEKAWQEIWQNCHDSKRKDKDLVVQITLREKSIMIKDNGSGMTEDVIREFFTTFGNSGKRGNEEDIGDMGMGRGQAMNFGVCLWISGHNVMLVDLKKGFGYTLFKRKQFVEGTTFVCVYNNPINQYKLNEIKDALETRILAEPHYYTYINNQTIGVDTVDYEEFCDELFRVFKHPHVKNRVYSQGIYVLSFQSNFDYCINVKVKSKLNMARNEFLETDFIHSKLQAKINEVEELMISEKTEFDKRESKLALSFLRDGRVPLKSLIDKNIILTANNKLVSLSSLVGKELMFGETNLWSDDCIQRGYTVLHKDNEHVLRRIFKMFEDLKIKASWTDPREIAKRGYFRDYPIEKITRNKAYAYIGRDMNEKIFCQMNTIEYKRKVDYGESDIRHAWTDGSTYIKLNKNIILERQNKEEICIEIWRVLCHEYAHDEPTKEEDYHNDEFYERFHSYIKTTAQKFANYMKNLTPKYLKDRYLVQS